MTIVMPEQASHFYWPDGSPCHSVPYADKKRAGEYRNTTVADCRKLGLFPSVTNILGIIAKPGLSAWKEEQSILASLTLPQRAGETLDAFAHRVVEDMKAQTKEAARKGSEIHKTIENYLLGKAINLIPQVKPAIKWLDENVIEVICAERVLVNLEQGYAGTVDLICVLRDTGKTTIIDFKTQGPKSGKFTVYPEWGLQLEAYRAAYEGDAPLEHIDLVSLAVSSEEPQDVLCHTWDQEDTTRRWEAFKAAHTLWKWSKNL